MSEDMTRPVTRGELREELAEMRAEMRAEFPTKQYVDDLVATLPTKQYVDDLGRTFFDALGRTNARIDQLGVDLMRHMNSLIEAVRSDIRAITEPFQDHGPRIEKLERAVFPEDGGGVRAKARVRRRTRSR